MSKLPAALELRTMATMPVRRDDVDVRRAILRELRRRELEGEAAPSWPELAEVLGESQTNVRHHARTLRSLCLVAWTSEYRSVRLTEAGRLSANCLLTDEG